ncbi:MAG: cyclic nucleotide-binding domain-containing protein [Rhodobiaceae bacterium]|nr:cyclic nucleotide-binding domain-containing protein [Rhodobiaceae bacterium]
MRKALYILADLDETDLTWFATAGAYRTVERGTTIIREGAAVTDLFIVLDGTLAVTVEGGHRVATLASGDIVGEMSLIEKRPPSASVTVLDSARVLAVPQAAIRERMKADDAFAARFYRALAVFLSDRLRATVSRLGYGDAGDEDGAASFEAERELDEGLLDTLHVAGDRMRRLISLLEGRNVQ